MSESSEQDALAFEYVSGTLRGSERQTFEAQLLNDESLQASVAFWEEQLMDLQPENLQAPNPKVWKQLAEHIQPASRPSLFSRAWQWTTPAFAALALMLAVFAFFPKTGELGPNTDYVAVLTDDDGRALLTALAAKEQKKLWLKWEMEQLAQDTHVQLWAVSRRDGETRPIAVLDTTDIEAIPLDQATWRLISDAEFLVLSEEEPGGSAIDEPSDRLLAKGFCVRLSLGKDRET